MQVISCESGPVATNSFLVFDKNTGEAVIIDAPLGITEYYNRMITENNLNLMGILLTHTHWDHVADCNKLSKQYNVSVFAHNNDIYRLKEPMKHTVFQLPFEIEAVENPKVLNDNDTLDFGGIKFLVIHTPGHTEGGVCFLNFGNKLIFTGDTIFNESIGRVDLPGGSMELLLNSIRTKIMTLPDDFVIYSGHGPSTTIGREKMFNPFLN